MEMQQDRQRENAESSAKAPDVVVVGAGFAGMYMLHRLRQLGLSVRVIEAGRDVGGTWYWNRYPGARCDAESIEYSYSFCDELQQDWRWTERYATQPEILRYAMHVADRFELRRDITFDTRVTRAQYDEHQDVWVVETDKGESICARFFIMATGCLSVPRTPEIEGRDLFSGAQYHTGHWPHEPVDFSGQRVAVIGTGSSGIQSIPMIARQAEHVYVFQRTPNFSVPARNAPLANGFVDWVKNNYPTIRDRARMMGTGMADAPTAACLSVDEQARADRFESLWQAGGATFMFAFTDLMTNLDANREAVSFVHEKIRSIVKDPRVAAALTPTDHPLGTKRICVDTDYYATYNRDNVTLVDARATPIKRLVSEGVETNQQTYAVDSVVYATGFDAMTGALLAVDIRGKAGLSLKQKWADGPRTYLGIATSGFPNLFMITGPGSPSVLSNVLMSIEQHVEWLSDLLAHAQKEDVRVIEANATAENQWVDHVNEVADQTLYPLANSWYLGSNVPGKPRVFMPYVGGVKPYRERCEAIAREGYPGFSLN